MIIFSTTDLSVNVRGLKYKNTVPTEMKTIPIQNIHQPMNITEGIRTVASENALLCYAASFLAQFWSRYSTTQCQIST
jgi:hypothetical protein